VNLEESSQRIREAANDLNEVVTEVKTGEGTFHHIIKDTTLVRDIDETVRNVRKGSEMLNENLEAMRHNVLFRGYFKKLEKQEKKEQSKKTQ
jgi:phospholipid/cholesterol/gamma-HCH transport system substrate-binding protein